MRYSTHGLWTQRGTSFYILERPFASIYIDLASSLFSRIIKVSKSQLSDLLENIVNIVDVHHLENCRCKSSLVKSTECDHVFDAFDPYHLFLRPCERLFWPRFWALGWWNVWYVCFRFGRPRTAVPEQANRSDENIVFPFLPSLLLLALLIIVGQNRVRGFEWQFWILTEFKAKLAIGVFEIVDAAFTRPNSRS